MTESDDTLIQPDELELLGPPEDNLDDEDMDADTPLMGGSRSADGFIEGAEIGTIVVAEILTPILQQYTGRQKIGFEFVNESSRKLTKPKTYRRNGFMGDLVNTVPGGGYVGLGYAYGRKGGGAAAGVISYKISGTDMRLGMMYSMRRAYAPGHNYFKFATFKDTGNLATSHDIWKDFYYNRGAGANKHTKGQCYPAHVGTRSWADKGLHLGFEGTMPDGGEGIMRMVLRDR